MQSAANTGIDAVFVRWGFQSEDQLPVKPTYIVATPEELLNVPGLHLQF